MNGKVKTTALLVVLMTGMAQAVLFDDGDVHNVDWSIGERVIVSDDAFFGGATTFNLLPGGSIYTLEVHENSCVNFVGGETTSSTYSVSAQNNSFVTISSGNIAGGIVGDDNSTIIVSGGFFPKTLRMIKSSRASISGGVFEDTFYLGYSYGPLDVVDESTMEFIGTDFTINGTPVGPGEFTNSGTGEIHGTLAGTLANGDPINMDFWIYDDSRLILSAPVPLFIEGDANHDGVVSAGDYASVQANFGNTGAGIEGDANGDGVVSAGDYASVQANFGNTAPTQVTPEPVTLSMLALGGVALIRRKRNYNDLMLSLL